MNRQSKTRVTVEQDVAAPVERKVLAQAILDISKAANRLAASGLNHKGIVVLVSHSAALPQSTVRAVLDALEQLAGDYTR